MKPLWTKLLSLSLLSLFISIPCAKAESCVVEKKDLPEYIKSEAQGKLEKITLFTSKSGKYKIVLLERKRKRGIESRMIAYELLKSIKTPSVIRSTKWQVGYDFKLTEVDKWRYGGNPVLIIQNNQDASTVVSRIYVFKGPEMTEVNTLTGSKIAMKEDKIKDEVTLCRFRKGVRQCFKWNGEKLVKSK